MDSRKNCCNRPEIGTVSFYFRVMCPKDVDGMANSVDPDQEQSDLGLPVCPDLSIRKQVHYSILIPNTVFVATKHSYFCGVVK